MTNRISTRKKAILAIIVVLALAGIVLIACWIIQNKENPDVTAAFIEEHMTNDNGTIATYLKPAASENPDIVAGREALSHRSGFGCKLPSYPAIEPGSTTASGFSPPIFLIRSKSPLSMEAQAGRPIRSHNQCTRR